MQQPPTFATSRRVGCIMWLAIVALSLSIIGLFLDITQEMAWNQRVEQALAPSVAIATSAPDQLASEDIAPSETPTEQVAAVVIDPPVSESTTTPMPTPIPPSPTPQPTAAPQATWTPAPPGMNTDLIIDDIRWRAIGVEELGNTLPGDDFTDPATTNGKFVRVTMEIESRRGEPEDYEEPGLMDAQGRTYEAFDDRFFYLDEDVDCYSRTFNPNLTQRCADIFEVAADAGGYKLVVNNFEWPDAEEAIIELR